MTKTINEAEAALLIARSKHIFRSYDMGQNNVHDRQLLRDAIAFIEAQTHAEPIIANVAFREHQGLPTGDLP